MSFRRGPADDETVSEHLHPHWITLVPRPVVRSSSARRWLAIAFLPDVIPT